MRNKPGLPATCSQSLKRVCTSAALCRLTLALGCIGLTDGAPGFSSPVKQAKERCFDLLTLPSLLIYSANTSYLRGNGTPAELGPSHGETHSLVGKSPQKMVVESLR